MLQAATEDFVKIVVDKVQLLISEELRRRISAIEASAADVISDAMLTRHSLGIAANEQEEGEERKKGGGGGGDNVVESKAEECQEETSNSTCCNKKALEPLDATDATVVTAVTATTRAEAPVLLWSSEIASYMGQDSWQSRNQALARVWKRSHEPSFRDTREKWLLRGQKPLHFTSKQVLAEALLNGVPYEGDSSPPTKYHCLVDPFLRVQSSADVELFRQTHAPKDVARLYRTKGKLLEEETAHLFEGEIGQPVRFRNAGVFWDSTTSIGGLRVDTCSIRPPGPIIAPGTYRILGEIDACLLESPFGTVPVEFKLRMGEAGVSDTIPFRDIIQVQSYMAILDASRGLHVQRAFGTDRLVTTTIMRDQHLWDSKVVPAIEAFVCDVRRLLRGSLADEELRHAVLLSVEAIPAPPPLFTFKTQAAMPAAAPQAAPPPLPMAVTAVTAVAAVATASANKKRKRTRTKLVIGMSGCRKRVSTRASGAHSPVLIPAGEAGASNYNLRSRQ